MYRKSYAPKGPLELDCNALKPVYIATGHQLFMLE